MQPTRVSRRRGALAAVLAAALTTVLANSALPARAAPADPATGPFAVIDPQNWENPDSMTWDDFVPPPGTGWSDPSRRGSVRNFDIALVTLDYPDMPFVVTQAPRSTIFGNPQPSAANLSRDDVPAFYRDLLNTPNALNGG